MHFVFQSVHNGLRVGILISKTLTVSRRKHDVVVQSTGDGVDFVVRAITPLVGWLGNPAGFHFRPSADVGLACAVAETIERVLLQV